MLTVNGGGIFTLSASSASNGSAIFSTTHTANGITSDGAGLWYMDSGSGSNNIKLNTPNQNYLDGAPVCFKALYAVTGPVNPGTNPGSGFSIDNGATFGTLQLPGPTPLATGDIPANTIACASYNTSSSAWNITGVLPTVAYLNRVLPVSSGGTNATSFTGSAPVATNSGGTQFASWTAGTMLTFLGGTTGSGTLMLATQPTVAAEISGGATFSVSGCSASSPVGGADTGTFSIGTSSACTATVTIGGGYSAAHGWACKISDLSHPADQFAETSTTTTTAVFQGTGSSSDSLQLFCRGY